MINGNVPSGDGTTVGIEFEFWSIPKMVMDEFKGRMDSTL